jgi:FG-GAP-like repeat/ASPIC and UnbV
MMRTAIHLRAAAIFVAGFCSLGQAGQFTDVSVAVGLIQERQKSWGNPIWGDINNDGYPDLIVPTHGLLTSRGPFVYLNNGGASFSDIRSTSGIGRAPIGDDGDWHGFAFGDYDGDGNLDVYVTEGAQAKQGGRNKLDPLFKGNGDGTFSYASLTAGVQISMNRGRCSFWVDYDNDGHLDLFVKNYDGFNLLYRNNGNGTFTSVADAGGLADAAQGENQGSIVSFTDYDNDGFMDLMITGDQNIQELFHNQGNGTFVNSTASSGILTQPNAKGVAWGDYNNDGFMDLFIARVQQGSAINGTSLYRNNRNGTFTDVTAAAGLAIVAGCWTGIWGDYDNDGLLDLFATNSGRTGQGPGNANLLFHNNGDGTFTNVARTEGVDMENGVELHKGAAWADYDNNGFLDLVVKDGVGGEGKQGEPAKGRHFLFRNKGNLNHFIKVNLKGKQSNFRGVGARLTVTSAAGVSYRQNSGGGGGNEASQGSEPFHVGIGAATNATVKVNWPSGIVDTLTGVPANSTVTIVEGSGAEAGPGRLPNNR